jgi:hypothetical protein
MSSDPANKVYRELGRQLLEAHERGIKPGEGTALCDDARRRLDWQRMCGTIARAAGRLQHQARLAVNATDGHWESHRRMMEQLFGEIQNAMPGEAM